MDLPELSAAEIARYGRHLVLPEVGLEGQRRLKAARVLMIGAGGLGSPLGLYLAAAGIGRIGLVDFDRVDASNLHRQVLYGQADVGRPKLEAAAERLREINPTGRIDLHECRFTSANAREIAREYDIIADGTDNFATRYLVNDLCVLDRKINVYGSVYKFEGQATVFDVTRGPCYRCLYPEPPPPGMVPSCAEGGVLGILPGIIGLVQATETVKLILGKGETLVGRLLLFDALAMEFREMKLKKNPDCPICGESPTVTDLIDYDQFCSGPSAEPAAASGNSLKPAELQALLAGGRPPRLVDVREPHEFEICHLPGATLVPVAQIERGEIPFEAGDEAVLYCHHGVRSLRALETLRKAGYRRLRHLAGGIDAWSLEVDPSMPRY